MDDMNERAARGTPLPTIIILSGLALTAIFLPSDNAVDIFSFVAIGAGLSLGLATAIDAKYGVRNLIRVDLLIIWVLYGLTLLEFLFPQPGVETALPGRAATSGAYAVLLGFASIVLGRHLVPKRRHSLQIMSFHPNYVFVFFVFAALLGYMHILLAINFDIFEMFRQMSLPRFSQAWQRGRYGDIHSLLFELGLLIYLLPPIAGLIFARKDEYSGFQKLTVGLVLALTFYYAFASGTRNVIATYAIALVGAFFLSKPGIKMRQVLLVGIPSVLLLLVVTALMLEFRSTGIGGIFAKEDYQYDTLFIDQNIVNLSKLTQVFPDSIAFLGFEVPYQALIKPIPRFLWPGKPEGLSTSIEVALGSFDAATTFSCTFVGEAYMAAGFLGVVLAGLCFGAAAECWNNIGRDINSSFAQVLYASGFLCAAMSMRSILTMVPYMLPTVALWIFGKFWLRSGTRPVVQQR